jgi:D-alanyl-D-alanine carboxypeptidase
VSAPPVKPPAADGPEGERESERESRRVGPDGTRDLPMPAEPAAGKEPRDPLRLLAELTNTPPPPQTLARSVLRRFKIWTPLVVVLAIVFVVVQALRPLPSPGLTLTAPASYTFNGTPLPQSLPWPAEGQSAAEVEGLGSLGVRGAQTPVPIASVTKVMTAYVILRDHPLSGRANGPVITVDDTAAKESASTDESTAHVRAGQRFTERQMLQLLLIPSGNNIARLLARWDAGTQEAFVAKMRREAAALGMTRTTYTGASGFEETTVSTAVDQLKLAHQVMQNDVFRSVVAMPNISIPGVGTIYNNNNDLVHLGVVGIKTGSSTPAGGALMWAAHKTLGGRPQLILGVVLQQRGGRSTPFDMLALALANSQKMIDAIQAGLTQVTIVKKGEVVGYADDGLGGHTPVVAAKDLVAIGWTGMRTGVNLSPGPSGVPHSAASGAQVGTVSFGTGPARTSVPAVLQGDLREPSFGKKLTRLG